MIHSSFIDSFQDNPQWDVLTTTHGFQLAWIKEPASLWRKVKVLETCAYNVVLSTPLGLTYQYCYNYLENRSLSERRVYCERFTTYLTRVLNQHHSSGRFHSTWPKLLSRIRIYRYGFLYARDSSWESQVAKDPLTVQKCSTWPPTMALKAQVSKSLKLNWTTLAMHC